ncbi:DinB family protein [Paenibacillus sp. FSL W8-1187]|uniref:DinB family protein n=1 Tax=Paenibacillus sp. FSL W8-1187 TaxID=2975339 RepID=UPI0030DB6A67
MSSNREKTKLLEKAWEFAYSKEDWSPPLQTALEGVTEEQADWRPQGAAANTIRETVHHLIFYKEAFLRAWRGESDTAADGVTNTDTFHAAGIGAEEASWEETRRRLGQAHAAIGAIVREWEEDSLYEKRIGKGSEAGTWVNSLAVHDAYHAGQIILVRKLQGSWAPTRSFS